MQGHSTFPFLYSSVLLLVGMSYLSSGHYLSLFAKLDVMEVLFFAISVGFNGTWANVRADSSIA